ncbi:MAG: AlwI family type II restriction endonuclease [Endomicrobium sp.]|jgi:hypothetical protein|nr:AlwI family type II restriction endonuclease [Endomicrobium sp.]
MTVKNISFKSCCWSIGTTSYRTKEFNANIEKQLALIEDFWKTRKDKDWNLITQAAYYKFMQSQKFVKGEAGIPEKDAREKTSGLVDIGLLTADRKLTPAGLELLHISRIGDFSKDNELNIAKDSYIYLKQLLKMSVPIDSYTVRPFILLVYFISKLGFLSKDEYTYILPLCINEETTEKALLKIQDIRNNKSTIDSFITDTILSMDNYKEALNLLISSETVNEDLIIAIGMNRKSHTYDKSYYKLYKELFALCFKKKGNLLNVYKSVESLKLKSLWKDYLFSSTSIKTIKNSPEKALKKTKLLNSKAEKEFKTEFFKLLHLFKVKANLADYLDLNRRYFRLTDTVLFKDNLVKMDIIPEYFFKDKIDKIYKLAFTESEALQDNISLTEISKYLVFDNKTILQNINAASTEKYKNIEELKESIDNDRLSRFKQVIKDRFTDDVLIKLLGLFESRKQDSVINEYVTDNADVPTIFEYVIGIIWYKLSEQKGNILKYMNLSLDADLLPKSHANGGMADIEYYYDETEAYPAHTILLEATLTNDSNQRRTEMEPVSRHLGEYLLKNKDKNSYCVFLTNYLDINVISDFRNRKTHTYYSSDGKNSVDGMKIIPLQTEELKTIISKGILYKRLYPTFDKAYNSDSKPNVWYNDSIKEVL